MSKDETLRRLTARHLAAPDPASWLIAADRCEELGDDAGAVLWRRRGALYAAVREQYDEAHVWAPAALWRNYPPWEVGMARYPQTVRVWTDRYGHLGAFALVINVNVSDPRYVVRRLLELIDRLEG